MPRRQPPPSRRKTLDMPDDLKRELARPDLVHAFDPKERADGAVPVFFCVLGDHKFIGTVVFVTTRQGAKKAVCEDCAKTVRDALARVV